MPSSTPTAAPAVPESLLLSAGDLARHLRTTTRTIWRWDQSGQLGPRPLKIGSTVRWRRCEVMAWLSTGCLCRRDWVAASLPRESSCHDAVGGPSAKESRRHTVTAKATPVIQPLGPTPLLDFPRAWELFRFILSKQTRERIFDAEHEYLMAGYHRARHPRYNTPWCRLWLNFAFAWRTVALIIRCFRSAIWAAAVAAILRFLRDK